MNLFQDWWMWEGPGSAPPPYRWRSYSTWSGQPSWLVCRRNTWRTCPTLAGWRSRWAPEEVATSGQWRSLLSCYRDDAQCTQITMCFRTNFLKTSSCIWNSRVFVFSSACVWLSWNFTHSHVLQGMNPLTFHVAPPGLTSHLPKASLPLNHLFNWIYWDEC